MCLDHEHNAIFPPSYTKQNDDLWRVCAATVDSYGPALVEQIDRFMPYWETLLDGDTPAAPPELWELLKQLKIPMDATAWEVAEGVVAGRTATLHNEIRHVGAAFPDNVWAIWWMSLIGS